MPDLSDILTPGQPAKPAVTHRAFDDIPALRKSIFDNVLTAAQTKYPIENSRYRLELRDLAYKDDVPYDIKAQKQAIITGSTLDRRLTGAWHLVDKATNKVVDKKSSTIAHVPYLTNRGTFIYSGNEYTISNQMRLKPGVFARQKENGILESHFNAKPGTGQSFRLYMEPETGVFRLGVGQSNLKLYPILRAMGASDKDIEHHWGPELLQKNVEAEDPRAVGRAFSKLVNERANLGAEAEVSDESGEEQEKAAQRHDDRRWTYLWFKGTLRATEHKGKNWVCMDVNKGLCRAAYDSLKAEHVECEPHYDEPHISVLRPEEVEQLKLKFGDQWQGAAKIGSVFRFRLVRIVSLVPEGWDDVHRVWFLECASPDLMRYRANMGFSKLPKGDESGKTFRFHITFAVHKNGARKAAELLCCDRAMIGTGEGLLEKQAEDDVGKKLTGVFDKLELDPDVTESTLGTRFTNASLPTILRASQKLLNISRGTEDVDDRDSLAYQTFHGPEDFFAERIEKDAGMIGRKLLWKSTLRGNLKHMPSGALTPQLRSVLLRSGLGSALEEINPLEIHNQHTRALRIGEGAISSLDAVPDESRAVQPSHLGFIDPIVTPESEKLGVDVRVAHGALKGSDKQIYTTLLNARTGKPELVSAAKAANSVLAFPGEMGKKSAQLRAMVRSRQVEYVKPGEVDYSLPSTNQMFATVSNMVPAISAIKGQRLAMGARYMIQALPLKTPEAPLVQNLADGGKSFDELISEKVGAIRAKDKGVVTAMDGDKITVRYPHGEEHHELYTNFPFNRKTFLHNTPAVKIGDKVAPGQLLASSNYTDAKGVAAVGMNLRTAYMPYKGLNFEDATVISESAAKKLSSEHMYQHVLEPDDNTVFGRKEYVSIFPTKFNRMQLAALDHQGVAYPGTVLRQGDPLILSLRKYRHDAVHKGHSPLFTDAAETWDHPYEGVVTDVSPSKEGGWNVAVKAYVPTQEGDKLSGRYGDKGVISRILPDDKMPHGADGKPYELLLNPQGIISRANPAQIYEALLGKVARKNGQAYKLPAFRDGHWLDFVKAELQKANMTDTEDLVDPETGKRIPKVLTGERFMLKLHHTAESKGKGRDIGAYTAEGLPARGGELGAKRVSGMEQNALLSHGATNVLRDAQVVRGQRNDDYWRAFRMGYTPPSPKVPLVYNKFLGYLQGAGINLRKHGSNMQVLAMTDKDVEKLSAGEITAPETVKGGTLNEIPGGLFDKGLTGGHNGNRWSHINLAEAIPNPIMEEPIRRMLGLTQKKFEAVLSGAEPLNGRIGGDAIREALAQYNVDASIEHYRDVVESGARSKRDNAVKVLGYLNTLKKSDMKPSDLMMRKVPVIPPAFRPVTQFNGNLWVGDPNYLYLDLMRANEDLKAMTGAVNERQLGPERLQLYNAYKAVAGLGDPVQAKTQERGVRGLLAHVFGSSPKTGLFQRRVLGSPVDVVGRATITPNPELGMDQVGLPEDKAWTIYRPFITRRLIRSGMPATNAAKAVANQDPTARKALMEEMADRPVMINRAPTLHRYGFMAAWPVLTKHSTLQIPPVITAGFNADFDGDSMNYHVPVTDEAVKDAVEKMMPSKNLHAVRDFKVHYLPRNEFLMGLYLASSGRKQGEPHVFRSKADALAAYHRGEIEADDRVVIK